MSCALRRNVIHGVPIWRIDTKLSIFDLLSSISIRSSIFDLLGCSIRSRFRSPVLDSSDGACPAPGSER
eukprot:15470471-Alexandrium_andersonii.AAC.1